MGKLIPKSHHIIYFTESPVVSEYSEKSLNILDIRDVVLGIFSAFILEDRICLKDEWFPGYSYLAIVVTPSNNSASG